MICCPSSFLRIVPLMTEMDLTGIYLDLCGFNALINLARIHLVGLFYATEPAHSEIIGTIL